MKVQELRDLLKAADRDLLEKAFVESYKHLTKKQKEEADQAIADALSGKSVKSTVKKESVNFDELELQITEFLENAYAQNYFAPNRIIPKSQRPKWRFMVKNYIKELEKISVDDANYTRSAKLLTDLYHMLCEAWSFHSFNNSFFIYLFPCSTVRLLWDLLIHHIISAPALPHPPHPWNSRPHRFRPHIPG